MASTINPGRFTTTEASDVQQRFLRGEINALSCSTTFELGVDVGELQAVVLRNMPPSTANYVQQQDVEDNPEKLERLIREAESSGFQFDD